MAGTPLDNHLRHWVRMAITWNLPSIRALISDNVTEGRDGLHIVVAGYGGDFGKDGLNEADIIAERSIGERDLWKHPFEEIARSKAAISQRTGKPTIEVPLEERRPGETVYWGSAVFPDLSMVVACSGFQPEYDVMISEMIGATIHALLRAQGYVSKPPVPDPAIGDFVPEPVST